MSLKLGLLRRRQQSNPADSRLPLILAVIPHYGRIALMKKRPQKHRGFAARIANSLRL